ERKTTRGAHDRTRPSKLASLRTEKARNCLSPNGLRRGPPKGSQTDRAFVLPSRYGIAIVEIRGVAPPIPTLSCVAGAGVEPLPASPDRTRLPPRVSGIGSSCHSCHGRAGPAIHLFGETIPGSHSASASLVRGNEASSAYFNSTLAPAFS